MQTTIFSFLLKKYNFLLLLIACFSFYILSPCLNEKNGSPPRALSFILPHYLLSYLTPRLRMRECTGGGWCHKTRDKGRDQPGDRRHLPPPSPSKPDLPSNPWCCEFLPLKFDNKGHFFLWRLGCNTTGWMKETSSVSSVLVFACRCLDIGDNDTLMSLHGLCTPTASPTSSLSS